MIGNVVTMRLTADSAALVVQYGDYVVDRLYLRRCTP